MKKRLILAGAAFAYAVQKLAKEYSPRPDTPKVEPNEVLLYQFPYSPFCIKVEYILAYKQIPYQKVDLLPMIHSRFTRQISGQGKVPYISHGSQIISDSTSIALYLEEHFPNFPLFEKGLEENTLLLEDWLDEALVSVFSKVVYLNGALDPQIMINNPDLDTGHPLIDQNKALIIPWMLKRTLKKKGVSLNDKEALDKRLHEVLERVLALTQNQYLIGQQLSLADLTLASHLNVLDKLPQVLADPVYASIVSWRAAILSEIERSQTEYADIDQD